MIPRHRPPFGMSRVLIEMFRYSSECTVEQLEKAYSAAFNISNAILLPSGRMAIYLVFKATAGPDTTLLGPAYTCDVVLQAMKLAGNHFRLLDTAPGGFLMDPADILAAASSDYALTLCELYGIPYDLDKLNDHIPQPRVRILDMAMHAPQLKFFERMGARDVALLSFGLGKCMYAGHGGLLLLNNDDLAAKIRALRRKYVGTNSLARSLKLTMSTGGRVFAHNPAIYGLSRQLVTWLNARRNLSDGSCVVQPANEGARTDFTWEWLSPMNGLNRRLAAYNLSTVAANAETRSRQAALYFEMLGNLGVVRGFDENRLPQSHFPIRVSRRVRNQVQQYLFSHGIDTSSLFPLPPSVEPASAPNAAAASAEVVTLPMGERLSLREIEAIARRVETALLRFGAYSDNE